ncbi:hypothetical protein ACIO8F_40420 [Streptomyces sp. NPDC087228]|uniref:hypothetical protein n=1 Tax=unclassified Streptomyces TaxID=2593676 RepID=UPI0037FB6227
MTQRLLGTAGACYFAVAVAVGAKAWQAAASDEERRPAARWVLTAGLPATLGAAALGWLGGSLGPVAVIWLLAACVLWPTRPHSNCVADSGVSTHATGP